MDGDTGIMDLLQQFGLGQIDPAALQGGQPQTPPQQQQGNVPLPPQKPYFLGGQTGSQSQPGIDPALQAQALTGAPSIGGTASNGVPLPSSGGAAPGRDVSLDPLLAAAGEAGGAPFGGGPQPGQGGPPAPPPMPPTQTNPMMTAAAQTGGMPSYGGPPQQPGVGQPANVPLPPPRPPTAPQPPQPGQQAAGVPLPPPRPPQAPQAGAQLPPNAQPTGGTPPMNMNMTTNQMVTKAPPMSNGVPLPPSVQQQWQPPVDPSKQRSELGLTRENAARLGAGLSSVGQNWNKPGLAAFAGSAGAAIQGGEKAGDAASKDDRAAQAQHFNQMSTSFRDMLAAQQQNNMQAYREAQAKYLTARATAIQQNGGTSNAYQNTPAGKINMAETRIGQFDSQRRKSIDAAVRSGQMDKNAAQAEYQKLDQQTEQFRQRMYQGMGIDPKQADAVKSQGISQQNPIDTKGMNEQQFHSLVPMGAWFKNPDGRVMQRTKAPPGAEGEKKPEGEQGQQPEKTSSSEGNLDDYAAMNDQGAGAT